MKKFIAIAFALMLVVCMTVPAYAATPSLTIPSIKIPNISGSVKIDIPDSVFDNWFKNHPIELPESTEAEEPEATESEVELAVPEITKAKYVHGKQYAARLEIVWTEVENAEKYEVLITKVDGDTVAYTVEDVRVYDRNAECPKVYVEETSTWTAAEVQVRAVCGDNYGEWSEAVKISCNKLH